MHECVYCAGQFQSNNGSICIFSVNLVYWVFYIYIIYKGDDLYWILQSLEARQNVPGWNKHVVITEMEKAICK